MSHSYGANVMATVFQKPDFTQWRYGRAGCTGVLVAHVLQLGSSMVTGHRLRSHVQEGCAQRHQDDAKAEWHTA